MLRMKIRLNQSPGQYADSAWKPSEFPEPLQGPQGILDIHINIHVFGELSGLLLLSVVFSSDIFFVVFYFMRESTYKLQFHD